MGAISAKMERFAIERISKKLVEKNVNEEIKIYEKFIAFFEEKYREKFSEFKPKPNSNYNAYIFTCEKNYLKVLKDFVEKNKRNKKEIKSLIEFVGQNNNGIYMNGLMAAVMNDNQYMVKYLINDLSVDPNILTDNNQNALHFCAKYGNNGPSKSVIVYILLQKMRPDSINIIDTSGKTPLDYATKHLKNTYVETTIKSHGGLKKGKIDNAGGPNNEMFKPTIKF